MTTRPARLTRGLGLPAVFHPLLDPTGEPYQQTPCMEYPDLWDSDAPLDIRQQAAAVCRSSCAALAACKARRAELGPHATGVWAGRVITNRKEHPVAEQADIEDAQLADWIAAARVTLPCVPRPHRKAAS